jgi:hypothetical protein
MSRMTSTIHYTMTTRMTSTRMTSTRYYTRYYSTVHNTTTTTNNNNNTAHCKECGTAVFQQPVPTLQPWPTFEKSMNIQWGKQETLFVNRTRIHCKCGIELGWYSTTARGYHRYQTRLDLITSSSSTHTTISTTTLDTDTSTHTTTNTTNTNNNK